MPTNESKAFQKFASRFSYLQQHSQVIDVSLNKLFNYLRYRRTNGRKLFENLRVSSEKYPKLNIPSTEYARIINFSKKEKSDYCFLELYNIFSYYMKDILKEMYILKPKSIADKSNKTINYIKLTEFTSIDELVDYMIDKIFRDLEGIHGTKDLVKRIIRHTRICIPQEQANDALMYLEIRHLIIHNDSKVDEKFHYNYKHKLDINLGGKVPTDFETFQAALQAVFNYVHIIDQELIDKHFINARV
ncbi:MAG: hypothetical protein JW811_03175 [Clostridiales bacterium]|nr:hypothetical protein [Clostridiales bacterium]